MGIKVTAPLYHCPRCRATVTRTTVAGPFVFCTSCFDGAGGWDLLVSVIPPATELPAGTPAPAADVPLVRASGGSEGLEG